MLCMQTTRYIFKTKFKIILLTVCSQKLVLLLLVLVLSAEFKCKILIVLCYSSDCKRQF